MANKLITPEEATALFATDLKAVIDEHGLTDDEIRALLNAISIGLGGPGVESPSHSASGAQ